MVAPLRRQAARENGDRDKQQSELDAATTRE